MSDEYDILIELSADDVAKAADEREKRDAEILRLRAENEKLRAEIVEALTAWRVDREENEKLLTALKPFADEADDYDFMEDQDEVGVPVGDLRAAAAALKETGE